MSNKQERCPKCNFIGEFYEFEISECVYSFISILKMTIERKAKAQCPKCKYKFKIKL